MSETLTPSLVKAVRLLLNLTQEEMAAKLGCSITSERRFEYEATLPKVKAVRERFEKMAKKAGVEIEVSA
jgi:transcriptional regulator with XRE-family HTH domain